MKIANSISLLGVGTVATCSMLFQSPTETPVQASSWSQIKTVEVHPQGPTKVDTSYLKQANVGGLLGAYIGFKGKLPKQIETDFAANLDDLWDKKLRIIGVTGATRKNADKIVARYRDNDPDKKGIKTFVTEIDQQARLAHRSIDYTQLCDKFRIKGDRCAAYKAVTAKIGGKNLAAYGMTEVMPSKSGKFNYVMLDTLLRNAGENYVQSIPALGDPLMSVGFYQFTSHAIRHDATNVEGANVVNLYVKDEGAIPGSVVSLQGSQHHRAAYYFAVYNIGRLMKRLSDKEALRLASSCSTDQLTQFIATAHHLPSLAIKKAAKWVDNGCSKPYMTYLGPSLSEYATKTQNNLSELEKRI